jgi:hypothetical protein
MSPSAQSPMSPSAMSPSLVEMPPGRKTVGDVETFTRWMELINNRKDPVTMEELIQAQLKTLFPIIRCIYNKDITNPESWQPRILNKVHKESYKVLNIDKTDKVEDDLDWGGDDGLKNNWTLYYKYPEQNFVASVADDAEHSQLCEEIQDTTPRRYSICSRATENLKTKADRVNTKALMSSPNLTFKLGDVVLVPSDNFDRTKVDGASLVGVIVSINKDKSTCWVAVKNGLLHRAYIFHALGAVPKSSNNWVTNGLEDVFYNWKGLPKITEQKVVCFVSSVGGQGMVKCNCKGDCTSNSCACRKAGRLCSSCCHRNSKCCKNSHDP